MTVVCIVCGLDRIDSGQTVALKTSEAVLWSTTYV